MPPGTFHTELNVPVASAERISAAVRKVISSYQRNIHDGGVNELNEVLIQRQVLSPGIAASSRRMNQNSDNPYYLVEYDDETGRTDTVPVDTLQESLDFFVRG